MECIAEKSALYIVTFASEKQQTILDRGAGILQHTAAEHTSS